jgi:hypothetical protein
MDTSVLQTIVKFMLIGTVSFGAGFFMVDIARKRARFRDGWYYLTPGPAVWIAVVLGAVATAFFCFIYLVMGNARPDASVQMKWLLGMAVAFDIVTVCIAYVTIVEDVRWNDSYLERRTLGFGQLRMSWHELSAFGYEAATGYWWVSAHGGPRVRFSPYSNGFPQLCAKIIEHFPMNLPPADRDLVLEHAVPARAAAARSGWPRVNAG